MATSAFRNYTIANEIQVVSQLQRITPSVATSVLANGATDSTSRIVTGKSGWIALIQTDIPARVRVYATSSARTADLSRGIGMPITSGDGLIAEVITTVGGLSVVMTPQASFSNIEVPVVNNLPISVTNLSGVTSAINITFTVIRFEE